MAMNKERRAVEKDVCTSRSRAARREPVTLTTLCSTGEENGHHLSATANLPSNMQRAGSAQLLVGPTLRRWRM